MTALAGQVGPVNSITLRLSVTTGGPLGGGLDVDGPGRLLPTVMVGTRSSQWALTTRIASGPGMLAAMPCRHDTIWRWPGSPNNGNGPPPCEINIA